MRSLTTRTPTTRTPTIRDTLSSCGRHLVGAAAALALVGSVYLTGSVDAGRSAYADPQADGTQRAAIGEIYELQAAFHRAKTFQDINLMMSLWAPDATLTVQGRPTVTYSSPESIRRFWLSSGSFRHSRLSLVPSFKTRIDVHGDTASLYFECHDVANYADPSAQTIPGNTFLSGSVERVGGQWVFDHMTAGNAPLSPTTYYYP